MLKRCPSILAVTDNREAADYDLRISPGSSTLYKQNGDVAYQSPAKFRITSLAKDICGFVAADTPVAPTQSQIPSTMIDPALLAKTQAGGDTTALTSPILSWSQTPSKGIDPALLAKAQPGDAAAERQVGQAYFVGEDVPQDFMNAANWFRKAAEQGDTGAQTMLGLLYDTGHGVKQDYAQAEIWYRKAAEQGDSGGQTGLGSLYYDGDSVKQDYAQAATWYWKAAEQGNEGAQLGLGLLYDNGEGVSQDYGQAAFWYRRAAEQGNAGAQFSLGVLYHNGHGLAGLKWQDIDFENMQIDVNRSVVSQVVGRCKTEASQKPVPMDDCTAQLLQNWLQATPYRNPEDWVFASNSSRAGEKRGKQPLWLQTIMRYHIQPVVERLGITKRVSWHTFRRTFATLLKANGEDIKVVQELMRHGSTRVTLDIYAQAQMPAKRAAQQKVVEMVRAIPLPLAV